MEKVFRDPVYNLMRFDMDRDRLVLQLLDSAEVQRLRNIRQMGVSDFIFPGATHTRFAHSLGATYLMKLVIERMDLLRKDARYQHIAQSLDEHREMLLAVALLHDLGHFPFSHLMEEVIEQDHEAWSVRLIQDPQTEVHQILRQADPGYLEYIPAILNRTFKPSYVVKLISSQLDVDRMDYLRRDSLHSGVDYGYFDFDWLLHSLRIVEHEGDYELALDAHKGIPVAETYVLARYSMYQQVYLHKTERSAGGVMLKLLQRAKMLLLEDRLPDTPAPVKSLLKHPELLDCATFVQLDDVVLRHAISIWMKSSDDILSDLSRRFLKRRLFKTLILKKGQDASVEKELRAIASQNGFDPEYYLVYDNAIHSPYKDDYLDPFSGKASERIFLLEENGSLVGLSEKSQLIQALKNRHIQIERLCFPEELRQPLLAFGEKNDIFGI